MSHLLNTKPTTLVEQRIQRTCFDFPTGQLQMWTFSFFDLNGFFVALVKACVLKCIGIIKVWLSIAAFYSLNSLFHKGSWLYFQMYVYFFMHIVGFELQTSGFAPENECNIIQMRQDSDW